MESLSFTLLIAILVICTHDFKGELTTGVLLKVYFFVYGLFVVSLFFINDKTLSFMFFLMSCLSWNKIAEKIKSR